jgi:hypothetical protein
VRALTEQFAEYQSGVAKARLDEMISLHTAFTNLAATAATSVDNARGDAARQLKRQDALFARRKAKLDAEIAALRAERGKKFEFAPETGGVIDLPALLPTRKVTSK